MHYFYDRQFERYLLQFMRIFTEINVSSRLEDGSIELKRIPIIHGAMSRQVANIIKGNSENTMISTPQFSAYIKEVELDAKRRTAPGYVNPIARTERSYDSVTKQYGSDAGNRVTVERLMPVPYRVTFVLDILTSNIKTKMEILEQVLCIFNPMLQLQSNSNAVDWSRLFEVELTRINWSSVNIPVGADDQKEIASLTFEAPIYINPPAKVKVTKLIQQIVSNIHLSSTDFLNEEDSAVYDPFAILQDPVTQIITTPKNYRVSIGIDGYPSNQLVLRKAYGNIEDEGSWKDLLDKYGGVKPGTKIHLRLSSDIEDESEDIVGSIALTSSPELLEFTVDPDTLPSIAYNVNGIIDPKVTYPGNGLVSVASGSKFIIESEGYHPDEPVIVPGSVWGAITAYNGDIIEFNGSNWAVIFNSTTATSSIHTFNIEVNEYYKYSISTKEWTYTYLGEYMPGYWRIIQ